MKGFLQLSYRKISCGVGLLVLVFLCSSCATLFSSSTVSVQMNSQPAGAQYQLGPFNGKTPDSIAIPKKSIPDFATFELAGYEKKTVPIESGITGVFWVNLLFWPGMIVDIVTGDYKTLDITEVNATLTPAAGSATAATIPTTAPVTAASAAVTTPTTATLAAVPPSAPAPPPSSGAPPTATPTAP